MGDDILKGMIIAREHLSTEEITVEWQGFTRVKVGYRLKSLHQNLMGSKHIFSSARI